MTGVEGGEGVEGKGGHRRGAERGKEGMQGGEDRGKGASKKEGSGNVFNHF